MYGRSARVPVSDSQNRRQARVLTLGVRICIDRLTIAAAFRLTKTKPVLNIPVAFGVLHRTIDRSHEHCSAEA